MLQIGTLGDRRSGTTRLRQSLAEALAGEHIQIVNRGEGEALDMIPSDEALVLEASRKLGERTEHDELMITALQRLLQRYAPLFCRVGPRPEDGAAFGCWVDRGALDEAVAAGAVLKVNDVRSVPRHDSHAYVLVQEAGGRMSFHVRGVEGAKLVQVWRSD